MRVLVSYFNKFGQRVLLALFLVSNLKVTNDLG